MFLNSRNVKNRVILKEHRWNLNKLDLPKAEVVMNAAPSGDTGQHR